MATVVDGDPMSETAGPIPDDATAGRLRRTSRLAIGVIIAVSLFLLAIRMLATATDTLQPLLERTMDQIVTGDTSALGAAWLVSYLLMNGSIVAALGLSLFAADLLTEPQLFLMVAGSRLGAAGIVVLVGAIDYLADRDYTLRRATSLGLLTFVVTHSIYLPATAVGYGLMAIGGLPLPTPRGLEFRAGGVMAAITALAEALTEALGAGPVFLLAIGLMFVSLRIFNRVLDRVQTDRLRAFARVSLRRPWVALVLGFFVTAATTSVAFSLGVVVPLYNRGYVSRRHIIAYILGANIGTLTDTLVVAVVLETPIGVGLVLALLGVATVFTLLAVARYGRYLAGIEAVHNRIVGDPRVFVAVLVVLLLVPLAFVGLQ